ncbi:hypothetical protein TNCT_558411 [Trichonephila clavata]|uniref:Uncharacterized protein n=1 Tax=Trichonephila clavata TaxID=2740835 RepID=A0A8X6GAF9_TRICU|nr:hypothetical protein TNCT_558411 [Trichonephila clavata]
MPLKTRLRVSDVYSDSDRDSDNESINEEPPPRLLKPQNHQQKHAVRLMALSVPLSYQKIFTLRWNKRKISRCSHVGVYAVIRTRTGKRIEMRKCYLLTAMDMILENDEEEHQLIKSEKLTMKENALKATMAQLA